MKVWYKQSKQVRWRLRWSQDRDESKMSSVGRETRDTLGTRRSSDGAGEFLSGWKWAKKKRGEGEPLIQLHAGPAQPSELLYQKAGEEEGGHCRPFLSNPASWDVEPHFLGVGNSYLGLGFWTRS